MSTGIRRRHADEKKNILEKESLQNDETQREMEKDISLLRFRRKMNENFKKYKLLGQLTGISLAYFFWYS